MSALKSASLDTAAGRMKIVLLAASTLAGGWYFSGLSGDLLLKVAATVLIPLAIAAYLWVVEMIATPPAIHAEQEAKIVTLQAELGAANESPDMVKIDALMRRYLNSLNELRKGPYASLPRLAATGRFLVQDFKAIFGQEYGEDWGARYEAALNDAAPATERLRQFKDMEQVLDAIRPQFTSSMVTTETPNINAYVARRLEALRMES